MFRVSASAASLPARESIFGEADTNFDFVTACVGSRLVQLGSVGCLEKYIHGYPR